LPTESRLDPNDFPYCISVIMPCYFYQYEKKGCVVINIDLLQLDKMLTGTGRFAKQKICVTDGY
jgi:hypothetical protein